MSKIKTVLLINGVEVGELEYQGIDNFWQYGKFIPYSNFHDYSKIFSDYEKSSHEDSKDTVDLLEKINKLDLSIHIEGKNLKSIKNKDFKIIGNEFEHK